MVTRQPPPCPAQKNVHVPACARTHSHTQPLIYTITWPHTLTRPHQPTLRGSCARCPCSQLPHTQQGHSALYTALDGLSLLGAHQGPGLTSFLPSFLSSFLLPPSLPPFFPSSLPFPSASIASRLSKHSPVARPRHILRELHIATCCYGEPSLSQTLGKQLLLGAPFCWPGVYLEKVNKEK